MRLLKFLLLVAVVAAVVVGFYGYVPYGPTGETFVEVPAGTGTAGIAAALERAGVVRSRYAFEGWKEWLAVTGKPVGTLKAGEYRFDHAATVGDVYDRLRRGDVYTVTVVVPEGFNVFDVAAAVAAAGLGSREAFLRVALTDGAAVQRWSPGARSVEGYLFPDTYRFGRKATPEQMIAAMVKRFGQVAGRLGLSGTQVREAGPSASPQEDNTKEVGRVVTMASLVEKEVHVDGERAVVAGVFENRLAAGMPLQTDPTVIYASELRGTWTGVIHQSELHSDSEYNTYAHKGLPPGPICSPGVASLKAAMAPARTDALYFVAAADGTTRFSKSLEEHNGKVAEYRKGK